MGARRRSLKVRSILKGSANVIRDPKHDPERDPKIEN